MARRPFRICRGVVLNIDWANSSGGAGVQEGNRELFLMQETPEFFFFGMAVDLFWTLRKGVISSKARVVFRPFPFNSSMFVARISCFHEPRVLLNWLPSDVSHRVCSRLEASSNSDK